MTADKSGRFQTGRVLALSMSHFIHDVYSSFLAPLLPLLIEKLSMSLTQAGFLTTVMQLPSLANPFIGVWADRISVRWFLIIAPAATAVSMSLIGVAPNYGILVLFLFAAGISVAAFHVPAPVMVSRMSGAHVGRGMSFFMTGGEAARAVGPLLAVAMVTTFGLDRFFAIMVLGLLASLWLYLQFRSIDARIDKGRTLSVVQTWREMQFVLLPICFLLVARGFMHASIGAFLPTFLKQETGRLWIGGLGLTFYEAAGVAGVLLAGTLSDRWGRRPLLLIGTIGAPIGLMAFLLTDGWLRLATLLFTGLTLLSSTPVMLAMIQEHAKSGPAAANGIFMMTSFIARSAIVVVVGWVADRVGLHTTYMISAGIGLIGIPFILMLPKRASDPSQ